MMYSMFSAWLTTSPLFQKFLSTCVVIAYIHNTCSIFSYRPWLYVPHKYIHITCLRIVFETRAHVCMCQSSTCGIPLLSRHHEGHGQLETKRQPDGSVYIELL